MRKVNGALIADAETAKPFSIADRLQRVAQMAQAIDGEVASIVALLEEGENPKPIRPEVEALVAWEGIYTAQPGPIVMPRVLEAGSYRIKIRVDPPAELTGMKRDFRVLWFDEIYLPTGKGDRKQFHVECGERKSRLYVGSDSIGWPGNLVHEVDPGHHLEGDYVVNVPHTFQVVIGEYVPPERPIPGVNPPRRASPDGMHLTFSVERYQ